MDSGTSKKRIIRSKNNQSNKIFEPKCAIKIIFINLILLIGFHLYGQEFEIYGNSQLLGRLELRLSDDSTSTSLGRFTGVLGDSLVNYNTFSGFNAGNSGIYNTGCGANTLFLNHNSKNTTAGYNTMYQSEAYNNTIIGSYSFQGEDNFQSFENTALGSKISGNLTNVLFRWNTFIGSESTANITQGNYNVLLGHKNSYNRYNGNQNIIIGQSAGYSNNGSNNVIIGDSAAIVNQGSNNIILGNQAALFQYIDSNILWVENSAANTPLLFGNFDSTRVGINCNNPQGALSVVGDILATGSINALSMACSSDQRLKKDCIDLEINIEDISKLRPVRYHWRIDDFPEKELSAEEQIGLVAQELEEIYPELVHTGKEGSKSVSYDRLAVFLTKGIQELAKKHDQLEERINALN